MAEQHHSARVAHTEDVDAEAIRDDRVLVVVDGELNDRFFFFFFSTSIGMVTFLRFKDAEAASAIVFPPR